MVPDHNQSLTLFNAYIETLMQSSVNCPFTQVYGIPLSLLQLMVVTVHLVNDIDSFGLENSSSQIPIALRERTQEVESDVCGWVCDSSSTTGDQIVEVEHEQLGAESTSDPTCPPERHPAHIQKIQSSLNDCISSATHAALVVYLFSRVHQTNPVILQQYVEKIYIELEKHDALKREHHLDAGLLLWPIFIGACEAVREDLRQQALKHVSNARLCGMYKSSENMKTVIMEVWRRRDASKPHTSSMAVMRDIGIRPCFI